MSLLGNQLVRFASQNVPAGSIAWTLTQIITWKVATSSIAQTLS
jgi:hypothetical protein